MCWTIPPPPPKGPAISASCNQGIFLKALLVPPTRTLFSAFCWQQDRDLKAPRVLDDLPPPRGPLFQFLATNAFL